MLSPHSLPECERQQPEPEQQQATPFLQLPGPQPLDGAKGLERLVRESGQLELLLLELLERLELELEPSAPDRRAHLQSPDSRDSLVPGRLGRRLRKQQVRERGQVHVPGSGPMPAPMQRRVPAQASLRLQPLLPTVMRLQRHQPVHEVQ